MEHTPQHAKVASLRASSLTDSCQATPQVPVPGSPFMDKIGFGTGVQVFKLNRSSPTSGSVRSPWAIKKLASRCQQSQDEMHRRLKHEAAILKKLNHPNIVKFKGVGVSSTGQTCIAMEVCDRSLMDLIEDRLEDPQACPFPAADILKVGRQVALALDHLHGHGVLHGDVKSANVLVSARGLESVKLCDFGVAIELDENQRANDPAARYIGTRLWSAPEVLHHERQIITSRADMFPYGLTLWEMLALTVPHLPPHPGTNSASSGGFDSLDESHRSVETIDLTSPPSKATSGTSSSPGERRVADEVGDLAKSGCQTNVLSASSDDSFVLSANGLSTDGSWTEEDDEIEGRLGSRPDLPRLDASYDVVVSVFRMCTEADHTQRASARCVLDFIHDRKL